MNNSNKSRIKQLTNIIYDRKQQHINTAFKISFLIKIQSKLRTSSPFVHFTIQGTCKMLHSYLGMYCSLFTTKTPGISILNIYV